MKPSGNNSKAAQNMKQKTLKSFFTKPTPSATPSSKSSSKSKPSTGDASKSESSVAPRESEAKATESPVLDSSQSSYADSSVKDTPPTSDYIDVDMVLDEDTKVKAKPTRGKRKIVLADSDEENEASSSPTESRGRLKKARLSAALSEEEDEEDTQVVASFSKRLTHFQKAPAGEGRKARSKASDDEADFIVASDSDNDARSVKSFSSRLTSSSRQSLVSDDEEEDDAATKKRKTKSKAKSSAATGGTANATSGGSTFLTAAEQRMQEKKNEKKTAENPYSFLADVKDKDGRRPGDPLYDPRSLYIPASAWKEFTPFEKQFWEIKQNHYDTVLFFQKGKFFELYEDDARIGHQHFDLKLTQRVKMSMVGVPEHSFDFWAAKFLAQGFKVGRVDQSETALGAEMRLKDKGKAKESKEKIVRRALHKVYTNGTIIDDGMITDEHAGHCISICEEESVDDSKNIFGICVLDSSTSQFNLSMFEDDICRTKLETLMRQARPKELLFLKGKLSVATTRLLKAVLPAACVWTGLREVEGFGYEETLDEVKKLYPAETDNMDDDDERVLPISVPKPIREMADSKNAIKALGNMIWYLRQLNIDKGILSMKNFNIYDPMKKGQGMVLDGQSLAHLELLLNNEGTEDGTLLRLLGRCVTPSGKRLFRIWLCMPLKEVVDINARLDAVEALIENETFEEQFASLTKGLPDLERIVSRIHAKNCKVRDFLKVLEAFKKLSRGLSELADMSEPFGSKTILGLLRTAPNLKANIKNVEALYESPSPEDHDLIPRLGRDSAYDEIVETIEDIEKELDGELSDFGKKLGCNLKWWHSAVGNKDIYLVETSAGQKGIPKDWKKESGTKAKSRYSVPSLQKSVRALKEARETRTNAIKAFKLRVYGEFDADRSVWLRAIRVLAELDCLLSLAKSSLALGEPRCRPELVEGDLAWVNFNNLRHPTLAMSGSVKEFIPNDVKLGKDVGRIALLTGPNMAGKSTAMRMTATGVIMAQLGMLVPAEKASICPMDAILTRMGAYDNMFSNASTFKVELDECCKILRDATPKSLVILDELGRGTSTYDGLAIAGAVLHQLATHTLPLSFFATHYSSLTDDFAYHPNIQPMHMSTLVDDGKRDVGARLNVIRNSIQQIVFLYKLVKGVATSSFGTHVANLAGVPLSVVDRADIISKKFAEQFKERLKAKQNQASSKLPLVAQADFSFLIKAASGVAALPLDSVHRREVLAMLKQSARLFGNAS